jgi:DNA-binding beta-propeller fold protein YncE
MSPAAATLTPDAQTLYVSDSAAGRVVPVAIGIRQAARPVSVGQAPVICRLTPGGDMLLVVDTHSDDLAVIRANAPTPSLITLVSTGSRPRDLAIKMF